ncbi:MAG: (Fe-S)-binding protein [Euryarchaeota archaeon]|nr:(Fe-S)-binding protein [Euryarchaeota archaeon]
MDLTHFDEGCQRCGLCIDICPQYSDVEIIDDLINHIRDGVKSNCDITNCLTCSLCESVCPENLSLKTLIREARLKKVAVEGLTSINYLCDPDYNHNIFQSIASSDEPVLFKPRKASTVYFPGCYASYIHKIMALSMTRLMDRAGIDFAVLDGLEYCCGMNSAGTGNPNVMKKNGPKIIAKLKDIGAERIIASCPGCFIALSKMYPLMFKEMDIKVIHASQFLEELVEEGLLTPGDNAGGKVFYHDPCHLTRGVGIYQEPRKLLEKIPGTTLMNPNPEGSSCCGFGGGVRLNHPSDSIKISEQEHLRVSEEDGEYIITNCAGCRQNLIEGRPCDGAEIIDLAEYLLLSMGERVLKDDDTMIKLVNEAYARGMKAYRKPEHEC